MLFETVAGWIVAAGSAVLLIVIVVSWLASIRTPKSTPVGSSKWFALPAWAQVGLGLGGIVLFAYLGYLLWVPWPIRPSPTLSVSLGAVGLAAYIAGMVLALWARWALGAMYGVSTSSAAPLHVRHRLIRQGPYALVRHPMYLGYWLVLVGVLIRYRTWTPLALLVICVPSFYRRARREEAALAETFGSEWQAYVAQTRFLVPFIC